MESKANGAPSLSAIIIILDQLTSVSRLMDALERQTVREKIELVFVMAPRSAPLPDSRRLARFHSWQAVEHAIPDHGSAAACGVVRARAPVVAFTEEHALPAPNWAERLIAAHAGPYAAVGPAMANGNPRSALSWADFYMGYGAWAVPIQSGRVDLLMGHNASYKRSVL